uniref:Uncharacterized protein n=1 Tax=Acrobeloides nanus TaxID=290746 RepID=A0A914DT41_9BILA
MTVIFSRKGTDEMALEELNLLHEIIYYLNEGTLVIEIGRNAIQTTTLLEHSSFCWATGRLDIDAPNKIILCNNIQPHALTILKNAKIERINETKPSVRPRRIWPAIVVSAENPDEAKTNTVHKKTRHRTIQPNKRQIKLLKQRKGLGRLGKNIKGGSIEEVQIDNFDKLNSQDRKLACRYRKSCYETGKIMLDDEAQEKKEAKKEVSDAENEDLNVDDGDEELDEYELKLLCKYKPSCYTEIGMSMSEENKQKSAAVLSGKKSNLAPPELKKRMRRTVKDIAKIALKEVEEKREQAAKRPIPQPSVVDQRLQEIEEKLDAKNKCKYRRSCYESGKVPQIQEQFEVPSWLVLPVEQISTYIPTIGSSQEEKTFEEKKKDEVQLHCKYRKSCYETGVLPEINTEFSIHIPTVVSTKEEKSFEEKKKDEVQLHCKYRKSCYETGVLPELLVKDGKTSAQDEFNTDQPAPTTLDDLRLQCKYRTSCYQKRAQAETTSPELEKEDKETPREKERSKEEKEKPSKTKSSKTKQLKEEKIDVKVEEEVEEEPQKIQNEKPKKGKKALVIEENVTNKAEEGKKAKSNKQKSPKETEPESVQVEEPTKKPKKKKSKVEEQEPVKEEEPKAEEENKVKIAKEKRHKPEETHKKVEKVSKMETVKKEQKEPEKSRITDISPEKCKYRKSCYESGILPKIAAGSSIFSDISVVSHGKPAKTESRTLEDQTQSLSPEKCKYRKSCYETGKLPETITEYSLFGGIRGFVHEINKQAGEKPFTPGDYINERTKESCKYRKSCYAKFGIGVPETTEEGIGRQVPTDREVPKKMGHVVGKDKKSAEVKEESKEEGDKSDEEKSEKKEKKKGSEKKKQKVDDDEKPYVQVREPEVASRSEDIHELSRNLTTGIKLACHYRQSCYRTIDTNGIVPPEQIMRLRGEDCNRFRVSCMKKLGLPVKERAPIGPSGRRMCRKKKPEEADVVGP